MAKKLLSLHEMIDSAVRESEEEVEKTASVASEIDEVETALTGEETEGDLEKVASVDILELADTLEKIGTAIVEDPKKAAAFQHALSKLGAGGSSPVVGPGAPVTNESASLPQKEQKKDKARTVAPTTTPPAMETPNKLKTNEQDDGNQKEQSDHIMKTSAVRKKIRARLQKLAGEDVSPASISSAKHARNPEDEVSGGPPQQGDRALIASNEAAKAYTKRQAKATPKKVLRDILDEPALSAATDGKLQENLAMTSAAGAKIAQAREELKKVAAAGCTCRQEGSCGYCQIQAGVTQLKEKRASAQRGHSRIRKALNKRSQFGVPANLTSAGVSAGMTS